MVGRANALAPGRADAMMATAAFAFQVGDYHRTASLLGEVLARNPQNGDALDLLGRIVAEVGPADEAFRILELARQADPKLVSLPLEVARVAALTGDWATAEARLHDLALHDVPRALVAFSKHRILKLWRNDASPDEELERVVSDPVAFTEAERNAVLQFLAATKKATPEVLGMLGQLLRLSLTAGPRQIRRGAFNAQIRAEVLALHGLFDQSLDELEESLRLGLFDELWIEGLPLFEPLRGTPRFEAARATVRERAAVLRAKLPLAGRVHY